MFVKKLVEAGVVILQQEQAGFFARIRPTASGKCLILVIKQGLHTKMIEALKEALINKVMQTLAFTVSFWQQ